MLELGPHQHLPQNVVRRHQNIVVIEQDVVDTDNPGSEFRIRERRSTEQRHVHRVVHVVIQVRPVETSVNEARVDQSTLHGTEPVESWHLKGSS